MSAAESFVKALLYCRQQMVKDSLRIVRSPEKLERDEHPGSDVTNTTRDYKLLAAWGHKKDLLYSYAETESNVKSLDVLVEFAFNPALLRTKPTLWYYTGHGLNKTKASKLRYSASPFLDKLMEEFLANREPREFDPLLDPLDTLEGKCGKRKVEGGELFLHKFGFCDLYGLLKFWCGGVWDYSGLIEDEEPSHLPLVIILDSCHSGELAQQLHDFVRDVEKINPGSLDEINIAIQAACSPDERTFGGYFTPVFTFLNDPDNEELLEKWKDEWEKMGEEDRSKYKLPDLPSPMVVTTLPPCEGATREVFLKRVDSTST